MGEFGDSHEPEQHAAYSRLDPLSYLQVPEDAALHYQQLARARTKTRLGCKIPWFSLKLETEKPFFRALG